MSADAASQHQLLLVDDDPEICELVSMYLGKHGFNVTSVGDGSAMDEWLSSQSPDLILLDLMLPGEDGLSIACRLRAQSTVPVIIISARGEDVDRIVGLEIGADDYLPKPFNPRELVARVRAVLRRDSRVFDDSHSTDDAYSFGPYTLDVGKRQLLRDGSEIALSRAEFDLLTVLTSNPNIVLSRDQIMDHLKHCDRDPFDRSVDVRVTRLRHKIEDDAAQPHYIRTVWGVGYQFTP
jgi:two-component system phosphate regulon response regulator OmpR